MRAFATVLIPAGLAIGCWVVHPHVPGLVTKEAFAAIGPLFVVAWGVLFFALPKLTDVTGLEGLSSHERDVLIQNVKVARARIWRAAIWMLLLSIALSVVVIKGPEESPALFSAFGGFAAGVGIVFLMFGRTALEEIHDLTTEANARRYKAKAQAEFLSKFAEPNGH